MYVLFLAAQRLPTKWSMLVKIAKLIPHLLDVFSGPSSTILLREKKKILRDGSISPSPNGTMHGTHRDETCFLLKTRLRPLKVIHFKYLITHDD